MKARLPFHSDKQIKKFIREFNGNQIPTDQCDIHTVLDDRELITAVQATHQTLGEIVIVVSQARSVKYEKDVARDFDYNHLAGHESYGWSKLKDKNGLLKEYGF